MAGLSDCKYTGKDCTVMLGITSPYTHELPEYLGYDITKLRGNARFLEIVLNREGESNGIVGLYFDGATNYFSELPLPNSSEELRKVYSYIENTIRKKSNIAFLLIRTKRRLYNWINLFNFAGKWQMQ